MRLRVVSRKTGVGGHFLVKFARQGGHDENPLPSHRFQPGTNSHFNVLPTFIHSFYISSPSLSFSLSQSPWRIFARALKACTIINLSLSHVCLSLVVPRRRSRLKPRETSLPEPMAHLHHDFDEPAPVSLYHTITQSHIYPLSISLSLFRFSSLCCVVLTSPVIR